MPELAFVMSRGQEWFIKELAQTIRYELELQGIPSSLHLDGFPAPRPDLVYAVPAPRQFVALEGEESLPDDSILKRTVFIGADPPGATLAQDDIRLFRQAGAVFDIDVRSVLALHRAGIPARTLRPGYSQLRDRFDPNAPRPIDVMFLGAHSPRRTQLLAQYAPVLSRHNCLVQIADSQFANATGSGSFLAEPKYDLLAQTRVVINLHRDQYPYFESLRAVEAMHCGAVVVSEHATGIAPFVAGEHLLVGGADSLAFLIEAVLRNGDLQDRLRRQAYERLSSWLPFALSISVLRAALVELVGNPVDPDPSLGHPRRVGTEPVGRWNPPAPPEPDLNADAVWRELTDARVDLIELRRHVVDLQRTILWRDGAPTVRLLDETEAWGARRTPRLTAVTFTSHDADDLLRTLDSLTASWLRDLEIVVVDIASSEDSSQSAAAWLRAHPRVPARLLAQRVDLGRGSARNAAVEHARAQYCLMLDPGNEIASHCLDVLLGTLDAMPDATFAYPIVAVTGAVELFVAAGGDHLVNFFGWEPSRLRLGNYIFAPYLVRTDRLREIGGFTADPRLQDWEDYDLWCRMAEHGWRGQLVPQILASQQASIFSSERSTTGPAASVGLRVLAQRAPRLMARLVKL